MCRILRIDVFGAVFKLKSLLDGRELDGFLVENAGVQGAAYVAGLRMGDLVRCDANDRTKGLCCQLYDINSHQCANAGVLSEAMQSNKPVVRAGSTPVGLDCCVVSWSR